MFRTKLGGKFFLKEEQDYEDKLNAENDLSRIHDYILHLGIKIYKLNQSVFSPFGVPYDNFIDFLFYLKKTYNNIDKEYLQLLKDDLATTEQEITNLTSQLNTYKTTWDGHTCSCSHSNYNAIKTERDNLTQEKNNLQNQISSLQTERDHLKSQLAGKSDYEKIKQDIIKQIIQESSLGLGDASLEQLISKIKKVSESGERERELNDLKQEKNSLQQQLTDKEKVIADLQKPNEETMKELKGKIRES